MEKQRATVHRRVQISFLVLWHFGHAGVWEEQSIPRTYERGNEKAQGKRSHSSNAAVHPQAALSTH